MFEKYLIKMFLMSIRQTHHDNIKTTCLWNNLYQNIDMNAEIPNNSYEFNIWVSKLRNIVSIGLLLPQFDINAFRDPLYTLKSVRLTLVPMHSTKGCTREQ